MRNYILWKQFQFSGYVKKQNYRYWASANPQELHQRTLHSDKLTGVGSRLLGLLALTSLKTTKVHRLLWHRALCGILGNFCEPELHLLFSMVPTRLDNSPFGKAMNECSRRNASTTCRFSWRWYFMAWSLTWYLRLWLLFIGVSQM